MQVTKEPLDPCQVALTIEVEGDKVVHAVDRAYREYAKYVSVPGFRKGKAPMSFVRQRVPEKDIRQRTAELLVEPAYEEAIQQEDVTPYAQPKLEMVQLDLEDKPFIFKALVPLAPQVTLGQYAGVEIERPRYELADADIDTQMETMRERAAEYPKVERPAQTGDLVVADVAAATDARPEAADPRPTMLELGSDNIPGFDEQIVGMSVGESKTFPLTYPDDYPEEDLAGEEAEFTVTVKEVRAKEVPALDDALAVKLTNGKTDTLEALRAELRADMEKSLLQSAEQAGDNALIDKIVSASTISYPPILTEAEVDDDVRSLLARLEREHISLEDYFQRIGKSREQVMMEITQAADRRIRVGLALGEIARTENLALTEADVDAAIAARAEERRTTPAALRAMMEQGDELESLRNRTQTQKVLDFLRAAAVIHEKTVKAGQQDEQEETEGQP